MVVTQADQAGRSGTMPIVGAIGAMGAELVGLAGVVLPLTRQGPTVDRCRRLAGIVERYGIRRALSGILFGSVDVVSGSLVCLPRDETDFALRGRLPLVWARHYSSAREAVGLLGVGWHTAWEVTLRRDGDQLTYLDEAGAILQLPFPACGSMVVAASAQLQIAHLPDGRLVVADWSPRYRVFGGFDAHGVARLKYVEDLHRQRIGCIWDEAGRLLRMRGTCGHELQMHYEAHDGARLSAIECVDGGSGGLLVRYDYGSHGELIAVRNRAGEQVRRFAYRDGQLVEAATSLGMTTCYRWRGAGAAARVTERATSEGARERFVYDAQRRRVEVTDVFGHTAFWQYDERGDVTSCVDFDGRRYAFDYADVNAPGTLHLPGNRTVRLEYDAQGRVVREIDPLGGVRSTQYAFSTNEPIAVTMSDGRTWMWGRNDCLQPVHYQTPSGALERFVYDADGLLARTIDALGVETRTTCNRWGQPTCCIRSDGATTTYEYDADGNLVGVTDALGAVTRIERDLLGRAVAIRRPDGRVERHVWNAASQRVSFTSANGTSRHWYRDRRGKVVRTVDEEGHAVLRRYDAHGRLLRVESANGGVRRLAWGARDCLSITDADGVSREFDYTEDGWIAGITWTAGTQRWCETFAYDAIGRLIARESRHARHIYRYDARGALEAVARVPTDAGVRLGVEGDEVGFERDAAGRVLAERGAAGELHHSYDAAGRLIATRLPPGQELRHRRYAGGAIALVELDGRELARFWYDAAGRPIARMLGSLLVHVGYDALGRPQRWRAVTSDDPGAPSEPTERDRQLWRDADYGAADEIVSTRGPGEETVWYDYDRRGCLVRRVSGQPGIEYFTWDGAGNLRDMPGGRRLTPVRADHRIREGHGYRYDHDAWGRLVRRGGRGHPLSLSWDDEGHLTMARCQGCTVHYRYDALGRRIEKRVERDVRRRAHAPLADVVTRYLWQGERLVQERCGNRLRTYLYLPELDDTIGFAPLARLDQTLDENGEIDAAATQLYHYHTDGIGTALALSDSGSAMVWRAESRAWGEPLPPLALGHEAVEQPLRFAGQYADEETSLHHNGRRIYDPGSGRYLSPDRTAPDGLSPYRYAPNPLTWCNPLGGPTPQPTPCVAVACASIGDLVPDPAQQITRLVEQLDDIPGWQFVER
ncbi:RHS repeat-associated core domain-containing protein [Burkholderia glumae]|uniref:RHS repeat-associated core domain-containing protein n=2 Tax=Burkholderia glumae TaxID=337 RepID=UPI001F1E6382|nr:RHS repeat-associated core domain-containing protein [Burkholderia glumae]